MGRSLLVAGVLAFTCGCSGVSPIKGLGAGGSHLDATTATGCVPGHQSSCSCLGGTMGVQTCNMDGQSLGLCMGCPASGPPPDAGVDDSGASSGDGGAGDAASDGGDAEAGPVCVVPDAGLPCEPGRVPCGGTNCTSNTNFCCGSATGSTGSCMANGSICTQSETFCKESADCEGGVCCMAITTSLFGSTVKSTCQAACPAGNFQLCRSNTDCDSGRCIPQSCTSGGSVEACSDVTGCTPR